ncbi:MAG TPA: ABC transporter permease [Stellaceae bacterium]|nr:ABC transporter permease [Stellaceae bacterium]
MDWVFLLDTLHQLLEGVPLTLELAACSIGAGALLALALALLRQSGVAPVAWFVRGYVFAFRGSPLLVQLFLIYYGLSQFPEIRHSFLWVFLRQPFWCAILALTLNTAAYGSEVIRGGLQAVPPGQIEAARACGMSGFLLFRRIILPVALRQALPAYGNEIIIMVKTTSLASIVTLMEVTGIAARLISETFRAFEVFTCAGAIYLVLNFLIARGVGLVEYRLSSHLRPAQS